MTTEFVVRSNYDLENFSAPTIGDLEGDLVWDYNYYMYDDLDLSSATGVGGSVSLRDAQSEIDLCRLGSAGVHKAIISHCYPLIDNLLVLNIFGKRRWFKHLRPLLRTFMLSHPMARSRVPLRYRCDACGHAPMPISAVRRRQGCRGRAAF